MTIGLWFAPTVITIIGIFMIYGTNRSYNDRKSNHGLEYAIRTILGGFEAMFFTMITIVFILSSWIVYLVVRLVWGII